MVHQEQISLSTNRNGDMYDLTNQVNKIVQKSGIQTGIAHIFNVGSKACIGTIEFEPGLQQDLPEILNKLMPPSGLLSQN